MCDFPFESLWMVFFWYPVIMQAHLPSRSLLIHTGADVHILKKEGLIGNFTKDWTEGDEREEIRKEEKMMRKF